jgi:hypothetical protein
MADEWAWKSGRTLRQRLGHRDHADSTPESEVQHPFIVYDNCHRSPSILIRPPCFSNRVRAADVPDFPALDAHSGDPCCAPFRLRSDAAITAVSDDAQENGQGPTDPKQQGIVRLAYHWANFVGRDNGDFVDRNLRRLAESVVWRRFDVEAE